jgi:hypothetical protein
MYRVIRYANSLSVVANSWSGQLLADLMDTVAAVVGHMQSLVCLETSCNCFENDN